MKLNLSYYLPKSFNEDLPLPFTLAIGKCHLENQLNALINFKVHTDFSLSSN